MDLKQEETWTARQKLTPDIRVYPDIKCCLSVIHCAQSLASNLRTTAISQAVKVLRDANWLKQIEALSADYMTGRIRKLRQEDVLLTWAINLTNIMIGFLIRKRSTTKPKTIITRNLWRQGDYWLS